MKFFEEFARIFLFLGLIFLGFGFLFYIFSKFGSLKNLPRMPLDIVIEKENFKFYFPLGTSILISVVLTLILNIIFRFLKK